MRQRARKECVLHTVGISEMRVSSDPGDVLVTYSLGSCVGLSLYDPVLRAGGLAHCMLPHSKFDPQRAVSKPCMFIDTGVEAVIADLLRLGAKKERLIAKVAGAANLMDKSEEYCIGERNLSVLRYTLGGHGIAIAADDTGGASARTLTFYLDTGRVSVTAAGRTYDLS